MDKQERTPEFNEMQTVKRQFFALRNGIVADTLRRAGIPHRIIFGLSVVDLKAIARGIGVNDGLSALLRDNVSTRESRLLWPMIADASRVDEDSALKMLSEVMSREEADILCNALLRRCPCSAAAAARLEASADATPLQRYAVMRMRAALGI